MSRKVLTTPYIVWGAAFIILPLFMVLYYGCTALPFLILPQWLIPFTTKRFGILSGLR